MYVTFLSTTKANMLPAGNKTYIKASRISLFLCQKAYRKAVNTAEKAKVLAL